jgi:hypothetical protein
MPLHDLIPSFNAGEVSPLIDARTSLEKYKSSCRTLENFIIMPYGGVNRRPGLENIAECYSTECTWSFFDKKKIYVDTVPFLSKFSTATFDFVDDNVTFAIRSYYKFSPGEKLKISGTEYLVHSISEGQWVVLADVATGIPLNGAAGTVLNMVPAVPFNAVTPAATRHKIFSFNYSPTTRYILEFGNHTIRIYSGDLSSGEVFTLTGVAGGVDKEVPYADVTLDDIQLIQLNDVIYISHPTIALRKLERLGSNNWRISVVSYDYPPLMEESSDGFTLTPSATTGTITITADKASYTTLRVNDNLYFSEADVGSMWAISHSRDTSNAAVALTGTANSSSIQIIGTWELTTSGTWTGNIYLDRSEDNGTTWTVIRTWNSSADRNYTSTGTQAYPALYRLRYVGSGTGRALLQALESIHTGIVKITSITSELVATCTVVVPLFSTAATKKFSETAFSGLRGHVSSMAAHEQRLFLSGNTSRSMSVWGSQLDDFENFRVGTNDSDGLFFTLASGQQNKIRWMLSQDQLIIGTNGDEWTIGGSDSSKTISPTNIKAANQSRYGSENIQAILLADVVLFVQRNGRKIRELTYSFERDGWVAVDLTLLAEHITRGSLKQLAYQSQPDNILWAIRGDGTLVGMTYERDQTVVGWHRHTTDGTFESVAVIYGNQTEDEVWVIVKRTINGVDKRFIERFSLNWRTYLDDENAAQWRYLDCHKTLVNPAPYSGLDVSIAAAQTTLSWPSGNSYFFRDAVYLCSGFTGTAGTILNNRLVRLGGVSLNVLTDHLTGNAITNASTVNATGTLLLKNVFNPTFLNRTVTVFHADSTVQTIVLDTYGIPQTAVGCAQGASFVAGLPYTSTLKPMRLNVDLQDGTSQGRKARLHGLTARLYKSRGGQAMTNNGSWYDLGDASGVFTGDRKITLAGNYDNTADVTLRQTQPFPLTVIAIIPKWDSFGSE